MFVSSYSTYIGTSTNDRLNSSRLTSKKADTKSSPSVLPKNTTVLPYIANEYPLNYVSNYKSFSNKQKLQDSILKKENDNKFQEISKLTNAKEAYKEQEKIYSSVNIPKVSLDSTPKVSKNYPDDVKNLKELNLRSQMVNTYLENDKYYQITAA
jgi:hypothetical protein